jgi:hypothetical protein|nr:hypothetical protein 3 - Chlamydomonas reinhardtii chloroplast [Chlamydomonas reinhardtii]
MSILKQEKIFSNVKVNLPIYLKGLLWSFVCKISEYILQKEKGLKASFNLHFLKIKDKQQVMPILINQ